MGMRFVDAQVACPVSPAVDFWTGPISTGGFLFSTYSSSVVIDGTLEVNTSVFTFDGADVGFKSSASKIVVNPSCTLRIINGSTLTNLDMFNRWQGIEVLAGGADWRLTVRRSVVRLLPFIVTVLQAQALNLMYVTAFFATT